MEKLIIIWTWWAWFTSWIYAWRYALNPLVIWSNDWWMITENPIVENFSGYPEPVSGYEIMENIKKQALMYGARHITDTIKMVEPIDADNLEKWYKVHTNFNGILETKSLILSIWTEKNKLNVKWEDEFFWKWVSYCATCDWFFYKGKTTAVVWGWDSAFIEALYLANICEKVYVIHRRDEFRAEPIRVEKAEQNPKIEFIKSAQVQEVYGNEKVEWMKIEQNGAIIDKKVDWFFVAIGMTPNKLNWLDNYLKRNKNWYIEVDQETKTNLPAVFAAWDCSTWNWGFRQLIIACAEWAVAAENAFKYLSKNE